MPFPCCTIVRTRQAPARHSKPEQYDASPPPLKRRDVARSSCRFHGEALLRKRDRNQAIYRRRWTAGVPPAFSYSSNSWRARTPAVHKRRDRIQARETMLVDGDCQRRISRLAGSKNIFEKNRLPRNRLSRKNIRRKFAAK